MRCDIVEWKRALRDQRDLTAHQVGAALALTLWMRRDGFIGDPPVSVATIAEVLNRNRGRVSIALTELVDLGWLERIERPGRTSYLWASMPESVQDNWPDLAEPVAPGVRVPVASGDRVNGEPVAPGVRVPVAPGDRVGYLAKQPVASGDRDLSRLGYTKSREGTNTYPTRTVTAAPLTAGGGEDMIVTPEDRPDLWQQASDTAARANGVRDLGAYRLAVFRRLVEEEVQASHADTVQALIDACPRCESNGWILSTEDGLEVAHRCTHAK